MDKWFSLTGYFEEDDIEETIFGSLQNIASILVLVESNDSLYSSLHPEVEHLLKTLKLIAFNY